MSTENSDPGSNIDSLLSRLSSMNEPLLIAAYLEESLREVLSTIREHLGMNVAFISRFQGGRRVFQIVDSSDPEPVIREGDSDPLESSYCMRVADGRLPNLIDDALQSPLTLALPVTRATGIRAHASVPCYLSDGTVYGTLCCFSTESGKRFDEKDLAMMKLCAKLTSRQVDKATIQYRTADQLAVMIYSIIENRRMHCDYQPIFDIRKSRIIGYEALSRFDVTPYRPPDIWFEAAGSIGLQKELEIAAIRTALDGIDWIPEDCYLSVNVSPNTVDDPTFLNCFAGFPLDRLVIEITEHDAIEDYQLFNERISEVREQGVQLAIDDVGAGYASLRHILEIRPDIIKLDRSLVINIHNRRDAHALAAAIIEFSKDMGIKVVAEGIETGQELEILNELGVNKAQGYLLGRPAPIGELQCNLVSPQQYHGRQCS